MLFTVEGYELGSNDKTCFAFNLQCCCWHIYRRIGWSNSATLRTEVARSQTLQRYAGIKKRCSRRKSGVVVGGSGHIPLDIPPLDIFLRTYSPGHFPLPDCFQCVCRVGSETVQDCWLSTILLTVASARAWNSLPSSVRNAPSLTTFRRELKTVLFRSSFDID